MNWLLFPESVGVPSRKPARPFQPFSNDGVPPWNPPAASSAAGFSAVTALTEIERAARALAQFRLPVVHQVVDEVEAEPDLVRALHPARIGVEGVGLVVAEQRIPPFRIAEAGIVGADVERAACRFPAGRGRSSRESRGCPIRSWCRDRATARSGRIASSRAFRRSGSWARRYRCARCRRSARACGRRRRRRRTDIRRRPGPGRSRREPARP